MLPHAWGHWGIIIAAAGATLCFDLMKHFSDLYTYSKFIYRVHAEASRRFSDISIHGFQLPCLEPSLHTRPPSAQQRDAVLSRVLAAPYLRFVFVLFNSIIWEYNDTSVNERRAAPTVLHVTMLHSKKKRLMLERHVRSLLANNSTALQLVLPKSPHQPRPKSCTRQHRRRSHTRHGFSLQRTTPLRPLSYVWREEPALQAVVADGLLSLLHLFVVMSAQVVAVVQGQLNWRAAFRTLAVAWAAEWHRVHSMLCSPGTYGLGAAGAAVGLVRPASTPRSPLV